MTIPSISILPFYVVLVFGFLTAIVRRASRSHRLTARESIHLYGLIFALLVWTGVVVVMGVQNLHLDLAKRIPLLWQALVPVAIWTTAAMLSPTTRRSLHKLAIATPPHWLTWIQALRIGAIGGISKGLTGEIQSGYVFWIGIPDLLFGLSALPFGWLVLRRRIGPFLLIAWNLTGFALIFLPTFVPMLHWMSEPGFRFIFEFPMILAPGMVVSALLSLNLMQAWAAWHSRRSDTFPTNTETVHV